MFRREALEAQRNRLHGDVALTLPVSWHLIGYGLLAVLAAIVGFLFLGSYSRIETVGGQLEPDVGSAVILPSRPGIVTEIGTEEGDRVQAGARLVSILAEETVQTGGSGPKRIIAALAEQDGRLVKQQQSVLAAADLGRDRLRAQVAGFRAELSALDEQIEVQRRLFSVARADYERAQSVAARGFISRRDLEAREESQLIRQQQLAVLQQSRADKVSRLNDAMRAAEEAESSAQGVAAGIAGERAIVAQRRAEVDASRGYILVAPVAGTVTAITARIGQPALPQRPLMTVVPDAARLEARLYIPTRAIGFLAAGQEVRLAVDAFPYQRFGTVTARIRDISTATVARPDAGGQAEPVYLATATIAQPWIVAFGRRHRLSPDMTLTARITTETRSLVEWLFEPVLAIRQR